MKRVRDAGYVSWGADSDNRGILLRMGIRKSAVRRRTARSTGRVDRTLLRSAAHSKKWRAVVSRYVELLSGTGSRLVELEAAMVTAANKELLNDERRREGWPTAAQARLPPLIAKRCCAMRVLSLRATKEGVSSARNTMKREVDAAKAT